jgi:molybdenum cofactor biosynthesis enzyme MoaA
MKLEDIGFYTLEDSRPENLSATSPMWRCEMILTERCNFKCPYCRGLRDDCQGDMPLEQVMEVLDQWIDQGLKNVRFSGGEPMLYPHLMKIVAHCKANGVEHIALSTNGSFKLDRYLDLVTLGVNDFSISFDACCAGVCGQMSGGADKAFKRISENIRELSKLTYVTVGVVLTDDNLGDLTGIVQLAHDLGVADIRIIPAAQEGCMIEGVEAIPQEILDAHPILAYRVKNLKAGRPVRSIDEPDSHRCYIPVDDSVVCGKFHFPCVIYMREQGEPIGEVGPNMRQERIEWSENHNSFEDPICQKNCLDVCIDHNNKCAQCQLVKNMLSLGVWHAGPCLYASEDVK